MQEHHVNTDLIAAAVVTAQQASVQQVNIAAMKFSCFLAMHLEHWFTQAEVQFALKGIILDSTKYYHVVSSFDSVVQECMALIMIQALDHSKYVYLQAAILKVYGQMAAAKAIEFLDRAVSPGLGDHKPSNVLAYLTSHFNLDKVFCQHFLRQLPINVHAQLDGVTWTIEVLAERETSYRRPESILFGNQYCHHEKTT